MLGPAAVTHPRGSKSACRGGAGELVHLDPDAPPRRGRDWWSCRPTKKDGSASETKHAKCSQKNLEGEARSGQFVSRCSEGERPPFPRTWRIATGTPARLARLRAALRRSPSAPSSDWRSSRQQIPAAGNWIRNRRVFIASEPSGEEQIAIPCTTVHALAVFDVRFSGVSALLPRRHRWAVLTASNVPGSARRTPLRAADADSESSAAP